MLPILYKTDETNFEHNGLGVLRDCTSCKVTEEANGIYEMELTYPVGSFLYSDIKGQSIIKAKANERYEPQLFRVYKISKPINGTITVNCEHISYELKDNFIEKIDYTGNCNSILNDIDNYAAYKTRFKFESNLIASLHMFAERRTVLGFIMGEEGSILQSLGNNACILRDNFNFNINSVNQDNNVLISYRKNLNGFKLEEDWSNCITKIYPYATTQIEKTILDDDGNQSTENEDITINLKEKYLTSQYDSYYTNSKIIAVDFTQEFEDDEVINEDSLREKAKNYFKNQKCDIPSLNYDIEFVELSKTEEYKHWAIQENVGLYDTIIVRHELYNIDTKVKIVGYEYDSISEQYLKLTCGQPKQTLSDTFNSLNNSVNNIKKVIDTKVSKTIMNNAIKVVSDAITGNDGGYVKLNPPENPSEILVMDNEDINKAKIVWRWNKSGWGVSRNGYNGHYYGLTKNGKLVIDETTANTLNANFIKTQVIESINDNSKYFKLDSEQGAIIGDSTTGQYTKMGAYGLEHVDNTGAYPYCYISAVLSCTFDIGSDGKAVVKYTDCNGWDSVKTILNGRRPRTLCIIDSRTYSNSWKSFAIHAECTAEITKWDETKFIIEGSLLAETCSVTTTTNTNTSVYVIENYGASAASSSSSQSFVHPSCSATTGTVYAKVLLIA